MKHPMDCKPPTELTGTKGETLTVVDTGDDTNVLLWLERRLPDDCGMAAGISITVDRAKLLIALAGYPQERSAITPESAEAHDGTTTHGFCRRFDTEKAARLFATAENRARRGISNDLYPAVYVRSAPDGSVLVVDDYADAELTK